MVKALKDYQVGERVRLQKSCLAEGEEYADGTVVRGGCGLIGVNRDDGVEGGGNEGAWLVSHSADVMPLDYIGAIPSTKDDQAAKQDDGKMRWGLLLAHMPKALEQCVAVRAYGESKYGTCENWKTVAPKRYLEAATRHVVKALQGERMNAADGGMNHIAQAVVDLLFALEIELNDPVEVVEQYHVAPGNNSDRHCVVVKV